MIPVPDQLIESLTLNEVLGVLAGATLLFAVIPGATDWQGLLSGVLAVVVVQLVHYAERAYRGNGFRNQLPTMDNRGSHETNIKAGAGAIAVSGAAATIVENHSLVYLVRNHGLGGVLYATFTEIIKVIQSTADSLFSPIQAMADGVTSLITAVFPARIINEGADFTAFSLTEGSWNFFGPFTFGVSVLATLFGLLMFMLFIRRFGFSVTSLFFWR